MGKVGGTLNSRRMFGLMASNEGVDTTVIAQGDKVAESEGRTESSESGRRVTRTRTRGGRIETAAFELDGAR